MRLKIDPSKLEGLPDDVRQAVEAELAALEGLREENPLQGFWPHSKAQEKFLASRTRTTAAIAGNQFGKTTSLVVKSLIECLPREFLPRHLQPYKRFDGVVKGRIVGPSYSVIDGVIMDALRDWTPPAALKDGGFAKGWNSQTKMLTFANGSFIDFLTYEADLDKFGGVRRHFVGYDEPPPQNIRDEGLFRIARYSGYEMFAFTPLKANTGWLRREIYKKRESPDITVVQGTIHDNHTLDDETRRYALENLTSDLWRRAREFGEFIDIGGMIYPEFERCVVAESFKPEFIRTLDIVIGIDPGIRNAGIVWVGFDQENVAYVFRDGLLQDKEAADYATFIRGENQRMGLDPKRISYVCDPAARTRGMVNAETVMGALAKEGIYCNAGQNNHEMGFDQLRSRMQHGRFHVDPTCVGLRDEADDYAAEEPKEGHDDSHLVPIKGNDHRLDALRYACMERVWDRVLEHQAPQRNLGWVPGKVPALYQMNPQREAPPMGFMS